MLIAIEVKPFLKRVVVEGKLTCSASQRAVPGLQSVQGERGSKVNLVSFQPCRSYCADCLNILVGNGTFGFLKRLDPWICFLCQPHKACGTLIPRRDWSIRVQELFANNSGIEFVSTSHPRRTE